MKRKSGSPVPPVLFRLHHHHHRPPSVKALIWIQAGRGRGQQEGRPDGMRTRASIRARSARWEQSAAPR